MQGQVPQLRQHQTGVWKVRWGGRDHYFTKDRAESMALFTDPGSDHAGSLARWSAWQAAKAERRTVAAGRQSLFVIEIAERFLLSYVHEGREQTARSFRKHLRRFLAVYGQLRVDELSVGALQAFKADLHAVRRRVGKADVPLNPTTIRHDITAVKTMLRWMADHELGPVLNLRAVKAPTSAPAPPERLDLDTVRKWIRSTEVHNHVLACYMALNYLCLARPSEIIRLAHGDGRFDPVRMPDGTVHPRGVFVLRVSKTGHRVAFPRHLVMSDEALEWFDFLMQGPRRYADQNAYARAVRAESSRGRPKTLQKSAAWHLQLQGVDLAEIDLLLGHEPSGVWRHYAQREFGVLRSAACRLSLRSSG